MIIAKVGTSWSGGIERLVGRSAIFVDRSELASAIAKHNISNTHVRGFLSIGNLRRLEGKNGHSLDIRAVEIQNGTRGLLIASLGDRWYRVPQSGVISLEDIAREPALWMGNDALIRFLGFESLSKSSTSKDRINLFWAGEVPPEVQSAPSDGCGARIEDLDSYKFSLRLNAIISRVRRGWNRAGPFSVDFMRVLGELGPQYFQQGVRCALGLSKLSPAQWPADWEERFVERLSLLYQAAGVQFVKVDRTLDSLQEQRIFAARLRYILESLPIEKFHPYDLRQMLSSGNLFGIPVSVDGNVLVIKAEQLIEDKVKGDAERKIQSGLQFSFELPGRSQMVLDGLLVRANHNGDDEAASSLRRIDDEAALHCASLVGGYRSLDGKMAAVDSEVTGLTIGIIRGGFGLGGASQEAQDWTNRFADEMIVRGGRICAASGYYHPQAILHPSVERTLLPEIDRNSHFDDVTRHLWDDGSGSDLDREELGRRYDDAVARSADAIADWAVRSGLSILIASQMANPFENPIALPAILKAREVIRGRTGGDLPVIFRHNYFRDPEGKQPRIPIWQDRDPLLHPNAAGVIHLVDGPANQAIAEGQYGISSHILPMAVKFPDISALSQYGDPRNSRTRRKIFSDWLAKFETLIKARRRPYRRYIERKYGIPRNAYIILSPSRISRNKRTDLTLRLMAALKNKFGAEIPVHLLVMGDAAPSEFKTQWSGDAFETMQEFRALADELGVADSVHYLGYVSHERTKRERFTVLDVMQSVDLISQMSEQESFGLTYLEATASGTPISRTNFNYPGENFEQLFPVSSYVYSAFDHFIRFLQESEFNPGMISRISEITRDPIQRRTMIYRNFERAIRSPHNQAFTLGYLIHLINAMTEKSLR